jgi:hypothetical protein
MSDGNFTWHGSEEVTGAISESLPVFHNQTCVADRASALEDQYPGDRTLSASEGVKRQTQQNSLMPQTGLSNTGQMDSDLLRRAEEIIEGFSTDDPMVCVVDRESLCSVILQLWETASRCSQFHQDILAILENALLSTEKPEAKHLSLFREAINDLRFNVLTQAHVSVIQQRFIADGLSPLALLTEVDDHDNEKK